MILIAYAAAVVLYFLDQYTLAFWVVAFSIAEHLYVVVRAYTNEDWYLDKRAKAGIEADFKDHRRSLAITKILMICILTVIAIYLFNLSGEIFNT